MKAYSSSQQYATMATERSSAWRWPTRRARPPTRSFFRSLKARGLKGVQLVTSDDHKGLKSAIERHFQGASWQRCQVHYARNLLGKVAFGERKELAEGLRGVFAATSRELALRAAHELADQWRRTHPKVAEHIEEHIEECLSCLAFPEAHRRRIRTTKMGLRGSTRS